MRPQNWRKTINKLFHIASLWVHLYLPLTWWHSNNENIIMPASFSHHKRRKSEGILETLKWVVIAGQIVVDAHPISPHDVGHWYTDFNNNPNRICLFVWFVSFLTPSSVTRLSRWRVPRLASDNFTRCHTETEREVRDFCLSRSHYTDNDPNSKGRTRWSSPRPPDQESRILSTGLPRNNPKHTSWKCWTDQPRRQDFTTM